MRRPQHPQPSLKRSAPGANPEPQPSQLQLPQDGAYQTAFNNAQQDFGFLPLPNEFDGTASLPTIGLGSPQSQRMSPNANQELIRRDNSQQIIHQPTPWVQQADDRWQNSYPDDEELEAKAQEAKRLALLNKKSIPPFVQKLSR